MGLADGLHKLGGSAYRHPWRIITGWAIVLALLGTGALAFYKAPSSTISIPGTPAQAAIDQIGELFPGNGGGVGRVVFHATPGTTLTDQRRPIEALVAKLSKIDGVTRAVSPFADPSFVSSDGTIAYAQVSLEKTRNETSPDTFAAIRSAVAGARMTDLEIELGGDVVEQAVPEVIGPGEVGGVLVALLVLVVTLGALAAAGMPIVSAFVGVAVSMAGLFALSRVVDANSTTPVLAVMLGLAVGIDYALFIINKYQGYVRQGLDREQAAARALGTAGNAVVFAAFTVIIALAALSVVRIPFMTTMGLTGAASIAVAALVALTLTPAFARLGGRFVIGRRDRRGISTSDRVRRDTIWYRWGAFITRHPVPVLLLAVVLVAIAAIPARNLTLGLPSDQYAARSTTERKAYDLLSEGFGVGFNGPLSVLVEGLPAVSNADRAAAGPYANYVGLQKVAARIGQRDDVRSVLPALVKDDGTTGIIQVIPKSAPSDSATRDLIADLRKPATAEAVSGSSGVTLAVTGQTALQEDINTKLSAALPVYLAVVVGLSLVLLVVAFRSLLVPLKATLGFLLSVLAMFGALVAAFQWGWFGITDAPGPIVSFIPIIAIGILFGLAMDYEFFLVSSMHEAYAHGRDPREAVRQGFGAASKVVLAAAAIMISVFAGFITNGDSTIQSIGFGLAVGIFVDAVIVRLTIVPAVMTLLGRAAWWLPAWLGRIIPNVSIEGEADAKPTGSKVV